MFKLNDNLISKGFPELERINREARKVLVDYYTNCERKYMDGMELVLDERNQKNAAAKQAEKAKVEAGLAQAKANLERDQAVKAALPKPSAPNPVIVQAEQRKAQAKKAINNATRAQQKRQSTMQTHQQRRTLKRVKF